MLFYYFYSTIITKEKGFCMQIVEVKNNLVKIAFDASKENLILSKFLIIKDSTKSFIAQVIYLESSAVGNFAITKLLFTFDNAGVVTDYNGAVPDIKQNQIMPVETEEFLYLLPSERKIVLGEIAQQKTNLVLDENIFEQRLLVCSEKSNDNTLLKENMISQLASKGENLVIFDTDGSINLPKLTATKDFKLPLNYETIDFIYSNGLKDATAESKAVIQDVFLEVQNYVKTLPDKFLPFDLFKDVVDDQYKSTGLVQLVLLKNKLLKYKNEEIFAQEKADFEKLVKFLAENKTTVIDLSMLDETFAKAYMEYVLALIENFEEKYFSVFDLTNENSDKKLLKKIYSAKNVFPTAICSYQYKYLTEIKKLSKNLFLFAPIQQQKDFASYNVFLNKLNAQEFIVYGKDTHFVPLIVKLSEIPQQQFINNSAETQGNESEAVSAPEENPQPNPTPQNEQVVEQEIPQETQEIQNLQENQEVPETQENSTVQQNEIPQEVDAQIVKDVDEIYTRPKTEEMDIDKEFPNDEESELSEDDLDFIQEFSESEPTSSEVPQIQPQTEEFDAQVLPESSDVEDFDGIEMEDLQQSSSSVEQVQRQDISPEEIEETQSQQSFIQSEDSSISPQVTEEAILPVYGAENVQNNSSTNFQKGETVVHPKYGSGTIEKIITYGNKTLCSINFDNLGRRLLDPTIADIKKA